jgi:hypothetical protein
MEDRRQAILLVGKFHVAEDGTHNVVEVMRNAAGERPHRFQPPRLFQSCLDTSSLLLERSPAKHVDNGIERGARQTKFAGRHDAACVRHGVEAQQNAAPVGSRAGNTRPAVETNRSNGVPRLARWQARGTGHMHDTVERRKAIPQQQRHPLRPTWRKQHTLSAPGVGLL